MVNTTYDKVFNVIYDRVFELNTVSTPNVHFTKTFSGKYMRKLHFNTNATPSVVDNGLYLVFVSDSAAATHPGIQGQHQLSFTDA
jgi:hypothetical protein